MRVALVLALMATTAQAAPPGDTPLAPPAPTPTPTVQSPPGETPPQAPAAVPAPPAATPSVQAQTAPLAPKLEQVEPPANARTEAWIATGVTALMVGAGVFSVVRMRQESDRANMIWNSNGESVDWTAASREHDRWFHATLWFGGLTVVSAAVTGVMWSRAQPSFRVAASPQGGYVGYAGTF